MTPKCAPPSTLPNPSNSYAIKSKPPSNLPTQAIGPPTLTKSSHEPISSSYKLACILTLAATQTWPNFKANFAEAHRDLRIVQTAAHGAGYQNANSAVEDLEPDYCRETTEALGQLATATAADRTAVANLTQANTLLSTQLGTANSRIRTMETLISNLQIQLRNVSPPLGSSNRSNHSDNNNNNNRNDNNNNRTNNNNNGHNNNRNNRNGNNNCNDQNNDNNTSYCHTHGRTRNDNHTSPTCRNPSNGHSATATLNNHMGGSEQWCADK
jgi:hypothetical protein